MSRKREMRACGRIGNSHFFGALLHLTSVMSTREYHLRNGNHLNLRGLRKLCKVKWENVMAEIPY